VLPFQELEVSYKSDINQDQYIPFSCVPPISLTLAFDGYRNLKTELEQFGIFTRTNQSGANAYNEEIAQLYSLESNKHMLAVVLDCEFPRTFKRSAMGISLSETQLQERCALLNHWMGLLLKGFVSFSPKAQELLLTFFAMPYTNRNDTNVHRLVLSDPTDCSRLILLMYVFPFV
jgi:hypothetical protein